MRLAELIPAEIKDPRVQRAETVTVTSVRIASDLQLARVLISVKSSDPQVPREVMAALDRASGFLRGAIGERMRLRRVPELSFVLDQTADNAARVEDILREIEAERAEHEQND